MRPRTLVLPILISCVACTAILDFEESECWCGEQWKAQISGAMAFNTFGGSSPISASSTTSVVCVTQLEHLALDAANPQDPLYVAIRTSVENAAIAKCETSGAAIWGINFANTNCATAGTDSVNINLVHSGACWESEDWDKNKYCPLFPECRPYYDCSNVPIWDGGGDEAGEDIQWECAVNQSPASTQLH